MNPSVGEKLRSMSGRPEHPWYRVVQYVGADTNWVVAHALRLGGDGPLRIEADGTIKIFYRHSDIIDWAKANGVAHLEF